MVKTLGLHVQEDKSGFLHASNSFFIRIVQILHTNCKYTKVPLHQEFLQDMKERD